MASLRGVVEFKIEGENILEDRVMNPQSAKLLRLFRRKMQVKVCFEKNKLVVECKEMEMGSRKIGKALSLLRI